MIEDDNEAFDEDYYVIDEPPAPALVQPRDPQEHRIVREQLAETVPTALPLATYWVVPDDVDWAD